MNRPTLEDFYDNPERYRRLAHRERARAVNEAIGRLLGGFIRLLGEAKAQLTPRLPVRWIERLG